MKERIYLDNNSSTPLDPRVISVLIQEFQKDIGNPSSPHFHGKEARKVLLNARQTIASFLGVKPNEIIFNSGATEGINTILRGLLLDSPSGHLVTSDLEHSCVYTTAKILEARGSSVSFLTPGLYGAAKPQDVEKAIRPNTRLISLMAVNNETGVKTDIDQIAMIAEAARIPFLVDGVALLGKEIFKIPQGVSAMCFSGHKLHAPKGIGFSFIRSSLKLPPLISGGEQEYNRRGGTENLACIAGLAEAVRLLGLELPAASLRMEKLRDHFEFFLRNNLAGVTINGEGPRVVNTSNLSFSGVDGESLLACLDMEGLSVSHGSACSSGALEPSRILLNMGLSREQARSSLRFSLSRMTTEEEINRSLEIITKVICRLRKI